jgi:hypothetical protein
MQLFGYGLNLLTGIAILAISFICFKIEARSKNHKIAAITSISVILLWVFGAFGAIIQVLGSAARATGEFISAAFGAIIQVLGSAVRATGEFISAAFGAIIQVLGSLAGFVVGAITALGLVVCLSIFLMLVLTFLIKYREDLLVAVLTTAIVTKIKSYLSGIWIFISLISWIKITNPDVGLTDTIPVPVYVAIIITAVLSCAVAPTIRKAIKLIKYQFKANQDLTSQVG